MHSPDFLSREAVAVLEVLTGARLDDRRACELGPERAGAAHFAKSIVVLRSMLAARHGLAIGMADILDKLRAPGSGRDGNRHDPARRLLPAVPAAVRERLRGHRMCGACAPLMADELHAPSP